MKDYLTNAGLYLRSEKNGLKSNILPRAIHSDSKIPFGDPNTNVLLLTHEKFKELENESKRKGVPLGTLIHNHKRINFRRTNLETIKEIINKQTSSFPVQQRINKILDGSSKIFKTPISLNNLPTKIPFFGNVNELNNFAKNQNKQDMLSEATQSSEFGKLSVRTFNQNNRKTEAQRNRQQDKQRINIKDGTTTQKTPVQKRTPLLERLSKSTRNINSLNAQYRTNIPKPVPITLSDTPIFNFQRNRHINQPNKLSINSQNKSQKNIKQFLAQTGQKTSKSGKTLFISTPSPNIISVPASEEIKRIREFSSEKTNTNKKINLPSRLGATVSPNRTLQNNLRNPIPKQKNPSKDLELPNKKRISNNSPQNIFDENSNIFPSSQNNLNSDRSVFIKDSDIKRTPNFLPFDSKQPGLTLKDAILLDSNEAREGAFGLVIAEVLANLTRRHDLFLSNPNNEFSTPLVHQEKNPQRTINRHHNLDSNDRPPLFENTLLADQGSENSQFTRFPSLLGGRSQNEFTPPFERNENDFDLDEFNLPITPLENLFRQDIPTNANRPYNRRRSSTNAYTRVFNRFNRDLPSLFSLNFRKH